MVCEASGYIDPIHGSPVRLIPSSQSYEPWRTMAHGQWPQGQKQEPTDIFLHEIKSIKTLKARVTLKCLVSGFSAIWSILSSGL